jgi:hypothetical protein
MADVPFVIKFLRCPYRGVLCTRRETGQLQVPPSQDEALIPVNSITPEQGTSCSS